MVKTLLLGYGHLGTALLEGLVTSPGCEVVGVFRWSGRDATRASGAAWFDDSEKPLAALVRKLGLRDIRGAGVNSYEFTSELQRLKPDLLLIGSWGEIVKPHILNFPDLTVVNCHPSLLPAHRGANPYTSVIRNGETQTGVTFHIATGGVDEGPILLQETVPVMPDDTGGSLRVRCAETARSMVPLLIEKAAHNDLQGTPQDDAKATYYKPLSLEDGRVRWNDPPEYLYNQSRALQPWLDCFGHVKGHMLTFKSIRPLQAQTATNAAAGTILTVEGKAITVASGDAATVLRLEGYRMQWGHNLLPEGISGLAAPWLIKPGQAFFIKNRRPENCLQYVKIRGFSGVFSPSLGYNGRLNHL